MSDSSIITPIVFWQIVNWFALGLLLFLFIIGPILLYRDHKKRQKFNWAILVYPWSVAVILYLLFQSVTIYG